MKKEIVVVNVDVSAADAKYPDSLIKLGWALYLVFCVACLTLLTIVTYRTAAHFIQCYPKAIKFLVELGKELVGVVAVMIALGAFFSGKGKRTDYYGW